MDWFRRKARRDPAEVSRRLREQALRVRAEELGLTPGPERPRVFGALMDLGYPNTVATLAAFADGSVSLYVSTGGGVIGAGEHEPVRAAAASFLAEAETLLGAFTPSAATPLPPTGVVRFYARTFSGTLEAGASEEALMAGGHRLESLFRAGHAVITRIRIASEGEDEGDSTP